MTRRVFIEVLREIADIHGLEMITFSSDWIIQLSSQGKLAYIYGYNFDINGSAAQQICGDKNATSLLLASNGIPTIHHEVFMNPRNKLVFDYIPDNGSIGAILKYSKEYHHSVVLKPLKGTGGNQVYRTTCGKEVEAAVLRIWETDYGVVISPYVEISDEIRVLVLNGQVRLMYRKIRQVVIADGVQTTKELLLECMQHQSDARFVAKRLSEMSVKEAKEVLPKGTMVPIEWRHNLGLGARAEVVRSDEAASRLAQQAAVALNMRFCSVDLIVTDKGTLSVLEVNSGVMMDSFLSSSAENRQTAKSIYSDAIQASLDL